MKKKDVQNTEVEETETPATETEGTENADTEEVDTEAVNEVVSEEVAKRLDAISTSIVDRFSKSLVKAQKEAFGKSAKADRKEGEEEVRNYFKALFSGDRQHLKATGYLDTGTDASAGYLVPEIFQAEVLRLAETQYGLCRRDMRYLPFTGPGNERRIPSLATSVSVSWVDEGASKPSTKATFGIVTQTLKKLAAIVPLTEELMEDSGIDLMSLLADLIAEAVAKEEDNQFLTGTGTPFTGVLNNGSVNQVVATGITDFADITADNLLDMIDATPTPALAGSKFYLSRTILSVIRKLKDGAGNYIFQNPGAGQPATIWNYPYELSDVMPAVGDTAEDTPFIIFGNLAKGAIIGDKQQIRLKMLDQATIQNVGNTADINLAEQDMVALRAVERVGYVVALPEAITVLKTDESGS